MGLVAVARNDQRRAAITLDHPRGGDADYPAVPALAIDHDAEGVLQQRILLETGCDGFQNAALFFLAVAVELVKVIGDFASARRILRAEEFDNVASHIHAPGGVDARRDAECHFSRGQGSSAELGDFKQRLKPRIDRRAQSFQSQPGEDAIFAGEGNGIGDSRDGDDFHERA